MINLKHVWYIAMKDLKLFATDRMALIFALLFPFLFVVMFSFILSDVSGEDNRLQIYVTTQEAESGMSHEIIRAMVTGNDSQLQPGEPVIVWLKDYAEARRMVEDKKIEGFLAFPSDFTDGVFMGYGAQLEVFVDAEATDTRAVLNGVASAIASQVGALQVAGRATIGLLIGQGLDNNNPDAFADADIGQVIRGLFPEQGGITPDTRESFIQYLTEKVGEVEPENASNFVIPGYLVMFVFFTATLSAEAIVRERRNNTLERLLAGSVKRESILGGIFTGTALKGLVQLFIFWGVGILAFKIDLGISPLAVIILSILMVVMSSAFAIMLATIAKTQRSASSIATLTSLVLAPLGGCWWPLFILPKWMQTMARITPHGWANTGFNKLMVFGGDFDAVIPEISVLIAFTVLFSVAAIWRFRTSAT